MQSAERIGEATRPARARRPRPPWVGRLVARVRGARTAIVLLTAVAIGVAGWRYHTAHARGDAAFSTVPVKKRRMVASVMASGTLAPLGTVVVSTQVSGLVRELFADFDTNVKKGQVIAKIDPQIYEGLFSQAKANYDAAQASLTNAQALAKNAGIRLLRARALAEVSLTTQAEVDADEAADAAARSNVDIAEEGVKRVAAALRQAEVNLSYTNIVSPIDGVVISRNVSVGQTVTASLSAPTLFTIAQNLSTMQIDTDVGEGDVARIAPGMRAVVTLEAFPRGRFEGKVREVRNAAQAVKGVVTYDAVIDIDNSDLRLRPGMTAKVKIIYAERPGALAIASAALLFRPEDTSGAPEPVRRVSPDGEPTERTVYVLRAGEPAPVLIHTGISDGTHTQVVDGLHDGDVVLVDPSDANEDAPRRARRRG